MAYGLFIGPIIRRQGLVKFNQPPPPPKKKYNPFQKQNQDQSLFQAEHFRPKSRGGLDFKDVPKLEWLTYDIWHMILMIYVWDIGDIYLRFSLIPYWKTLFRGVWHISKCLFISGLFCYVIRN